MPPRTFGPLSTTHYVVNGVAFDTIRVPPGRFVDGEGASKRELLISRPVEIGLTLVTQALWRAVTGESPSHVQGNDRPVEKVSWNDTQAFLGRLEALGLHDFRLPTEAEWAWAARCGVPTRWVGADRVEPVATVSQKKTTPVGGLLPSAAGALDVSGNVWEWQRDWWSNPPAAGVDVQGPMSDSYHVIRGGCWLGPQFARVDRRNHIPSGDRVNTVGLRLLREAP